MRKLLHFNFLLLALGFFAASFSNCTKNEEVSNTFIPGVLRELSLSLNAPDSPVTKVAIENPVLGEGLAPKWENGDEISIHLASNGAWVGTLSSEGEGANAIFKGEATLSSEAEYQIAYPAFEGKFSQRVKQTIDLIQTSDDDLGHIAAAAMFSSKDNLIFNEAIGSFEAVSLAHDLSYFEIKVSRPNNYSAEMGKISKISILSDSEILSSIDMSKNSANNWDSASASTLTCFALVEPFSNKKITISIESNSGFKFSLEANSAIDKTAGELALIDLSAETKNWTIRDASGEIPLSEYEQGMEDDPSAQVFLFSAFQSQSDYKNLGLVDQISRAINTIPEGSILLFEAKEYVFDKALSIQKSVTLKGVGSYPTARDKGFETIKEVAGAGAIETKFSFSDKNKKVIVYADDVRFKHLNLEGVDGNLVEFKETVRNFQTVNVRLHGADYLLSPRDAMTPELSCRYTTFSDSYNRGFFINRKNEDKVGVNIKVLDKNLFYRCAFSVQDPLVKDTRAISLDAGNNENPNIMDFDGLEIRECYFHDIGIASSKCRNFKIIDCEFYVEKLFDFPLHLEEFTRDVTVSGCLFTCNYATVPIMGVMDHSLVEDNVVVGSCYGFVQGRYAEDFEIRNNDLSQMITTQDPGSTPTTISIWDAVGSRDIRIFNNSFMAGATASINKTAENASSIQISGNTNLEIINKTTQGYDYPLEDGAICKIKNRETGDYLKSVGANAIVDTTKDSSQATLWQFTRVWPHRYEILSLSDGGYLYVVEGTEGYGDVSTIGYIPLQTKTFLTSERKPVWEISTQNSIAGDNILAPGGCNVSCMEITDGLVTAMTDENRRNKKVDTLNRLWSFEQVAK